MMTLLKSGRSSEWNNYRERNPEWIPDLSGIDLSHINLIPSSKEPFNLSNANLCGSKLANTLWYISEQGRVVDLSDAKIDIDTTYAPGFDPVANGAVFISKSEHVSSEYNKPRVFISYAWANEDVVIAIDSWLRSKGLLTKIDKRDFFAGARIRDEILRVMAECDVILVFYSKQSEGKPWPEFERELASDLEMSAKQKGESPPRIIYVVIDEATLPTISELNRLAVMAKGKHFELVCEEIYHNILKLPKETDDVDLSKWSDYVF